MRKKAEARVTQLRQQTQYTCMATSISSALAAHGKNIDEEEVNKVLGATAMRGSSWEEALACFQYFGMRGHLVVPATIEMLKAWTDRGLPVLIGWNPEGRPWSHASVVFKVDDMGNVHVMDPNIPDPSKTTRIVPREQFYKYWVENWNDKMLVRRPALSITKEVNSQGRQVMASGKNVSEKYFKGMPTSEFKRKLARKFSPEFIKNYTNPPPEVMKVREEMMKKKEEAEDKKKAEKKGSVMLSFDEMKESLASSRTASSKSYISYLLKSNQIPFRSIREEWNGSVISFRNNGDYYSALSLLGDSVPDAEGDHMKKEITIPS